MTENRIPQSEVPKTLNDAVEKVISILKPEEIRELTSATEDELGEYHFTLGLWIRNNFRLFDENSPLIKNMSSRNPKYDFLTDPDEISSDIIKATWDKFHGTNYMTELSDKAIINFLHYISKSEKGDILAVKFINELIKKGESLYEIFKKKSGFSLNSHKISDNEDAKYQIRFGYSAGPEAGDGGEWEVIFDKHENIKECGRTGQWIS